MLVAEKLFKKACFSHTALHFRRFFLPLCGKAGDLLWLSKEKGHTVVGVEGVESVVKEFFDENKIEFKKTDLTGTGSKYQV
jgi:hypothetical protein